MKTKILIVMLLTACCAWAAPKIVKKSAAKSTTKVAPKVKIQHFEYKDSIRFFDKGEPKAPGYKFTKSVSVDWPVTVNGKKSKALNEFLVEEVFYASGNTEYFPTTPQDVKSLSACVKKWVSSNLRTNTMVKEYVVKEYGAPGVKDLNCQQEPMSCWNESLDFNMSHAVGNLIFFKEYGESYYGGAHGSFGESYYAFDAVLDKPIRLSDIVTNENKVCKILPRYDHRAKENKMWDNIDATETQNFYIKDGKLVFVFQPYQVGPYSDGIVEVPVPLKDLKAKKLLTAYGKKLVNL